jgi:hypothetical protein
MHIVDKIMTGVVMWDHNEQGRGVFGLGGEYFPKCRERSSSCKNPRLVAGVARVLCDRSEEFPAFGNTALSAGCGGGNADQPGRRPR